MDVIANMCPTMESINEWIQEQIDARDDTWHLISVDICDLIKSETESKEIMHTKGFEPVRTTVSYNYIFLVVLTFQQDEEYL